MKALINLISCAATGAISFWAGMHGAPHPRQGDGIANVRAKAIAVLPDASALARETKGKLAALPASLWSLPIEETAIAGVPGPGSVGSVVPKPAITQPVLSASRPPPVSDLFPPSQVSDALSGKISAIVRANGESRLVVANSATTVRQVYREGDVFLGTWRIAAIQSDHVRLIRKGETVQVAVSYSARANLPIESPSPTQLRSAPAKSAPAEFMPTRRRVTRRVAVSN